MKRGWILAAMVMLFVGGTVADLPAFSFVPISQDFSPSGAGATRNFKLSNDGADQIAVKIGIYTRVADEAGVEKNESAESLFTVFPSRVVLKPHSVQVVKIRWIGTPTPAAELCYRVFVEQLPVQFQAPDEKAGAKIIMLFRYLGTIYIVPPHVAPAISMASSPVSDTTGENRLKLTFSNSGTAHAILNKLALTLSTDGGGTVSIPPEKLDGINGENILPGGKRSYLLNLEKDYPADKATIAFTFEPLR